MRKIVENIDNTGLQKKMFTKLFGTYVEKMNFNAHITTKFPKVVEDVCDDCNLYLLHFLENR